MLHTSSRWETDSVIKHVTDIEISCEKSKLVSLRNPPKKGVYRLAFDYWFSYDDHDPRVWCDILNFEVDRKVYFNNIYDCMLTKNESDLIWKISHGAIPTGRFLYGCKYSDSPNYNYGDELDDLTHIFVTWSRLSGLFQLTQSLIRKLTPTIDKFLFGGLLFVSQLVLVLMLMLDAYATGFLRRQKLQLYIVDSTNTGEVGLNV